MAGADIRPQIHLAGRDIGVAGSLCRFHMPAVLDDHEVLHLHFPLAVVFNRERGAPLAGEIGNLRCRGRSSQSACKDGEQWQSVPRHPHFGIGSG